jgi:branched-subunit amino acid transport protein AzlD
MYLRHSNGFLMCCVCCECLLRWVYSITMRTCPYLVFNYCNASNIVLQTPIYASFMCDLFLLIYIYSASHSKVAPENVGLHLHVIPV